MLQLKFGNHKLGDDTAIFNMSSAKDCPSKKLGLCSLYNGEVDIKYNNGRKLICYAEKAERQYPNTVPAYRAAQATYWRNTPAERILQEVADRIQGRRKSTLYLRYNESGDFYDAEDIRKLSFIAEGLRTISITTYGYTARSDLNFADASFLVKGSGSAEGNNGHCTVIERDATAPEGYLICPGSCKRCDLCRKNYPYNIAFRRH